LGPDTPLPRASFTLHTAPIRYYTHTYHIRAYYITGTAHYLPTTPHCTPPHTTASAHHTALHTTLATHTTHTPTPHTHLPLPHTHAHSPTTPHHLHTLHTPHLHWSVDGCNGGSVVRWLEAQQLIRPCLRTHHVTYILACQYDLPGRYAVKLEYEHCCDNR